MSAGQDLLGKQTTDIPVVKVRRSFAWSQEKVHSELDSSLLSGLRWKWSIVAVVFVSGTILMAGSIYLLCQAKRYRERASAGAGPSASSYEEGTYQ